MTRNRPLSETTVPALFTLRVIFIPTTTRTYSLQPQVDSKLRPQIASIRQPIIINHQANLTKLNRFKQKNPKTRLYAMMIDHYKSANPS